MCAICRWGVVLSVGAWGCSSGARPVVMHAGEPHRDVEVTTVDGRRVELDGASLHGGMVLGEVAACDGAQAPIGARPVVIVGRAAAYRSLDEACARPGARGAIRLDRIAAIRDRDRGVGAGAVAAAVSGALAAGAIITGTTFAVVSAGRSGGSGGGGSGGSLGGSFSCPHVYSFDGEGWRLDSGTYGAAYFPAHQRTDHDLLEAIVAVDGSYRLRIVNELDETEHVDAVGLTVIDHPRGTAVVPAPDGERLTFTAPLPPVHATDLRGSDSLAAGCVAGDVVYATGRLGAGAAVAAASVLGLGAEVYDERAFRPRSRLREAQHLAPYVSAAMDTSDGLIATLDTLSRLNGVGFRVDAPAIELLEPDARRVCEALGVPPLAMLAAHHGELELVLTVPAARRERFEAAADAAGLAPPVRLGRATAELALCVDGAPVDGAAVRNLAHGVRDAGQYLRALLALVGPG